MLKGIEIIKDRLQRKRKQYIHQGEKIEQMKCTTVSYTHLDVYKRQGRMCRRR